MPGYKRKRSYSRFRRRFRRGSSYRRRRSVKFRNYTRKPRNLRSRVRSLERSVESKWADATQVMTSISADFTGINLMPPIDAGTGTGTQGDRIGDTINLRYLQTRILMDVGDTTNVVRIICVKFESTVGVSGVDQVLQYPTRILGDSRLPIQSLYLKDGDVKYKILYDRNHYVNTTTSQTKLINIKIPLPSEGLKLTYEDSTTVQPSKQLINMYFASDSTISPNPGCVMNTRCTYNDA